MGIIPNIFFLFLEPTADLNNFAPKINIKMEPILEMAPITIKMEPTDDTLAPQPATLADNYGTNDLKKVKIEKDTDNDVATDMKQEQGCIFCIPYYLCFLYFSFLRLKGPPKQWSKTCVTTWPSKHKKCINSWIPKTIRNNVNNPVFEQFVL